MNQTSLEGYTQWVYEYTASLYMLMISDLELRDFRFQLLRYHLNEFTPQRVIQIQQVLILGPLIRSGVMSMDL